MKFWMLLAACAVSPVALAGKLALKNGDVLSGEIKGIDAENVLWVSDSLGEITVPKAQIENLESSELVKIDGHEEPCALVGMDGPRLQFSCSSGKTGDVPLLTVNKVEPYEDFAMGSADWTGRLSLTGFMDRGNTTEDSWVFDSFTEYRRGDYRNAGKAQFDSKSQGDDEAQERALLEYQFDWFFAERWFWTNTLATSYDDAKAIDRKYRAGTGIGYQFWENDITAFSVRGGASYVDEYYLDPELPIPGFEDRDTRTAWTLGVKYRYQFAFGASFFHNNDYSISNEDNENWQFEAETGFAMPLIGGVFGELKHKYDFDNQPQPGTKELDTRVTVGVGYSW